MTDCIKTTCALNAAGYGVSYYAPLRKTMLHHRLAYMTANGLSYEAMKGKIIRHKCDNPACVNPSHLVEGTQADNVADMWERNRANPGKATGSLAGQAKLTAEKVLAIRASNKTQPELASEYGVSASTISHIQMRKTWKHI